MAADEYNMLLHKRVDLPYSELRDCGMVAYVGHVEFAKGIWLGIIMDKPVGKNNGVVRGKKYFEADEKCGLFVRPSACKLAFSGAYAHAYIEGRRNIEEKKRSSPTQPNSAKAMHAKISPKQKQKNSGLDHLNNGNIKSPSSRKSAGKKRFHDPKLQMLYEEAKQRLAKNPPAKKHDKTVIKDYVQVKEANAKLLKEKQINEQKIKELYSNIARLEQKIESEQKNLATEHENEDKVRNELATVHNSLKELQLTNEQLRGECESKQAELNETQNTLNATILSLQQKKQRLQEKMSDQDTKIADLKTELASQMDIHQNVLLETKQRDAQKMKKMQSAVDAKEKEIADIKRNLQKATKQSKQLSGATDQKIEAMETKLGKSNALLETMKRQKEELNSKVRAQQELIEKLKSDSKKVSKDASEKSDKRITEQANTIKALHTSINDLKLKEKEMIEENKRLLTAMTQLKSDHEKKLASATRKQGEEIVKLNTINAKLTKDMQKLNSALGDANVEVEVLKKKLLDMEDMNRQLRLEGTTASKEIERLKKDRDKAVLSAQKHYEKYENLKVKHKDVEEQLETLKSELEKQSQRNGGPNGVDSTGASSAKTGGLNKSQEEAESPEVDDPTSDSTKKLPADKGSNNVENADDGITIDNNELSEQLNSLSAEWEEHQKKAKSVSKVSQAKSRLEQRIEQSTTSDEVDVGEMMLLRGEEDHTQATTEKSTKVETAKGKDSSDKEKDKKKRDTHKKKKKKANRNDAAAEQWARFFEQHGPEVAAQHGYTQAHYDQYLRRGGVPGGADAETF